MKETKNYKEATPEEVHAWQNGGDFFMTGKFDVMKYFVVVPALIQVGMFGLMLAVFLLNEKLF
jgi:hypothetical protein